MADLRREAADEVPDCTKAQNLPTMPSCMMCLPARPPDFLTLNWLSRALLNEHFPRDPWLLQEVVIEFRSPSKAYRER